LGFIINNQESMVAKVTKADIAPVILTVMETNFLYDD
jgi:hypothetical protein